MVKKCILMVAFAAMLVVSLCAAKQKVMEEPSPAKLRKDYEKINNYLEKNAPNDDPELNMAKVEEMLDAKSSRCTLFGGSSVKETLKMLIELANMRSDKYLCESPGISFMELLDSGLADDSRNTTRNYHLSRVNKIIEHYAFLNTLHCNFARMPNLQYGFKRTEYDYINRHLVESLPENWDLQTNMQKAEELLNSLNPREGALAEALEQFLELRKTLSEETCNENGMEILFKNDLATRGNGGNWYDKPLRRIDKIFFFYAKKHATICRPVLRKIAEEKLKSLHSDTYRNALGVVSTYYMSSREFNQLAEYLKQKETNTDFTSPGIVEYAKGRAKDSELCPDFGSIAHMDFTKLFRYVRAMSAGDQDHKYIGTQVDEVSGKKYVDMDKLRGLLDRYLFNPCSEYLSTFRGLKRAENYSRNMNGFVIPKTEGKFMEDLARYMTWQAYSACEIVEESREGIIENSRKNALVN